MPLSPGTHGVIIVHGIGEQRPGDILAEFSKAVCDTLINSPKGDLPPKIQLAPDISGTSSSVTMEIQSPYGDKAVWVFREAFWNDAFPPPQATQVLWWGVNQNLKEQLSSIVQVLRDPANKHLPTEIERQKEDEKDRRAAKAPDAVEVKAGTKAGVRAKTGLVSSIALITLVPLSYALLFVTWLLHIVPSIGPLDGVIKWLRKLDPLLSTSLGDVQRYVEHEIWSANARARLENIVISMWNDADIADITIVAHSMGAVVAYDALTEGGNIAEAIEESTRAPKKITLVTVGGAINRVFAVVSPTGRAGRKRNKNGDVRYNDLQIDRPLAQAVTGHGDERFAERPEDKFFWLDIFARRDPVPAGPVRTSVAYAAGIDPVRQMKERKVINKDSLILDHVTYWENRELVMPRILRAINGGTDYPWPETGIDDKKVGDRLRKALRYAGLTEIVSFLATLGALVFLYLKLTRRI